MMFKHMFFVVHLDESVCAVGMVEGMGGWDIVQKDGSELSDSR